jgi:hypothetical protein
MVLWLAGCLLDSAQGITLLPPGSIAGHQFGDSLSISGTTAAVGIRGADAAFERSGAVQILEYQNQGGSFAWVKTKLLTPDSVDDVVSGTWFGERVQLSGDFLVVGSSKKVRVFERHAGGPGNWGQTQAFSNGGFLLDGSRLIVGASVYERNGSGVWALVGPIPPTHNGGVVALSGDTAVTARYDMFMTGWVRVYQRDAGGQWQEQVLINEPGYQDSFAHSVALLGDWLVIGESGELGTLNTGRVYVHHRNEGGANQWGLKQTLTANGTSQGFGCRVALNGTRLAVGMTEPDQRVYVFERDATTFSLKGTFRPTAPYSVSFGRTLAISGDRLLVSDIWRNNPVNYEGAVFSFDIAAAQVGVTTAEEQLILSDPDAVADRFGQSISMDGDLLAVGAPTADDPFADSGAVYLYARQAGGNWTLLKKLVSSVPNFDDWFGWAVALHGDTLAVLSPGADCIHIYDRHTGGANNWGVIKLLTGRDGTDLSLDGDTLALADEWNGSIRVFERNMDGANAWGVRSLSLGNRIHVSVEGDTLVASGGSSHATIMNRIAPGTWQFVKSISTPDVWYTLEASSLDGDTLAIRSVDSSATPPRPREIVIVLRRNQGGANQWGEVARITPLDRTSLIGFGKSIKLEGTLLVVGAPDDTEAGVMDGSVYVYRASPDFLTWTLLRKHGAAGPPSEGMVGNAPAGNFFGDSVATNGDEVAVGAWHQSGTSLFSGAVDVIPSATGFADWLSQRAPGIPSPSPDLDADGDGVTLYQEYATGLDPLNVDSAPLRVSRSANGTVTYEFSLAKDAPDSLTVFEWSTDLVNWTPGEDTLPVASTVVSETVDAWIRRATISAGHPSPLFMRMRVAPAP